MTHTSWECRVSPMWHNTPVSRHFAHQIWAVAEESMMNLSAGLVSAAQSRAPPQLHRLSLRTAQGHGLCSEHHDRCGNYLNCWKKKKEKKLQHSRSVTGAGSVWADCELDSLIPGWMWRGLSTQEFSLLLMLPCHHPTHHPTHPLICFCFPTGEEKDSGRGKTCCRSTESCGQASLVSAGQWFGWPLVQLMFIVTDTVTKKLCAQISAFTCNIIGKKVNCVCFSLWSQTWLCFTLPASWQQQQQPSLLSRDNKLAYVICTNKDHAFSISTRPANSSQTEPHFTPACSRCGTKCGPHAWLGGMREK